ncbi:MAG TPA: catalase family peroxidase [Chthoniobacterales bacterium]
MNASESNPETPPPLSRAGLALRFGIIGAVLGGIAGLFAYVGGWLTPHALSPTAMVDRFQQVNGTFPGFRRNHAKGVCIAGTFESNGNGVALSRAAVFPAGRVPFVGRFAFAGGKPYVPDSSRIVRSLAILFQLPNGEEWRTGCINIPVFPVHTPQAFYDLLLASAPDPATGKPDGAKMKAFIEKYPEAGRNFPVIGANPGSSGFDNSTYNGLNAFRFINAAGEVTPVRWSLVPVQPFAPIGPEPEKADKNYLFDALIAAIHRGPLQWRLVVTVGQPGDPTGDASAMWPADRKQVDVGMLTIDRIESEDTSPTRDITFDPLVLPDGIAASDDPLLSARSAAYLKSFARREGERKEPSAVSPAEVAK